MKLISIDLVYLGEGSWRLTPRLRNGPQMLLKVAIKASRRGEDDWAIVATGTWKPGELPQLSNKGLPASLIQELFPPSVDPNDASGMTTRDHREFTYCMEWSREADR